MSNSVYTQIKKYISELNSDRTSFLFEKISRGKELRAKLICITAGNTEKSIKLSAIVETIHAASLLHDDVIDNSETRRGKISINKEFGNNNSIMMGDILYSKAFYELLDLGKNIAKSISQAVLKLSLGELEDLNMSDNINLDKNKYMNMIYLKTSSLIESSLESGAILANKKSFLYKEYGKNIGLSFQIIDDILDINLDSKKIGKPTFSDFREGKTTLPYIYLYENLSKNDSLKLSSLYKKDLNIDDKKWILEKMSKSKALEKSYNDAKELVEKAINSITNENENELIGIANSILTRKL